MNNAAGFFKQLIPRLSLGIDPKNDFSMSYDWNKLIINKDVNVNVNLIHTETIYQKLS